MDRRTEYVEKLSAEMVEWDNQIARLTKRMSDAMPGIPDDYSHVIASLQRKRDEIAQKLQGISVAGDHEWQEIKAGTDQVWGEVRTLLHDTIVKIA